ncbi:MAG: hypothetical protein HQM08_26995 [Candidatus Riflebacteria bacterium]|nr:hypothetical protein [Candidatus Riflebacteria bacterium]
MKKFVLATVITVAITGMSLISGCLWNFGETVTGQPVNLPPGDAQAASIGKTANVEFKVVLPENVSASNSDSNRASPINSTKLEPEIHADIASTPPKVTFQLVLVNVGNTANPSTTLSKTVTVGFGGKATVTFRSIPAVTVIGAVHIDGGSIASHTDFQGALDIFPNASNTLEVEPKGNKSSPDIIAGAIQKIIASSTLFLKAPLGLASKIKNNLSGLNLLSSTIYDDAVGLFLQALVTMPIITPSSQTFSIEGPISITQQSLTLTSAIGKAQISGTSGNVVLPAEDSASIVVVTDTAGNPFLLGFGSNGTSGSIRRKASVLADVVNSSTINATTTARAILVVCPLIAGLDSTSKAAIITESMATSQFSELVQLIQSALSTGQTDYLLKGKNQAIYDKAISAVKPSILKRKTASIRRNVLADNPNSAPVLTDNKDGTVTFSNNTFACYLAESSPPVFKYFDKTLPWALIGGRDKYTDLLVFTSPPEVSKFSVNLIQSQVTVTKSTYGVNFRLD